MDPTEALDAIFEPWNRPDSPGCVVGIVRDGESALYREYGLANIEHLVPNSAQTVFAIGSTSKQFTAACVVILASREVLSLDDEIQTYFPELSQLSGYTISVRNLLHHTSGIRDYYGLASLAGWSRCDYGDESILKLISKQRELNFPPGERFLYSNSNYLLLGALVRRVTGQPIWEFAEVSLFRPLDMTSTRFRSSLSVPIKGRATGYLPTPDGWVIEEAWDPILGPTGVYTNLNDLVVWNRNFWEPSPEAADLAQSLSTHGRVSDGSEIPYGMGLMLGDHRGLATQSHAGGAGGFSAEILRFPDQRLTLIILANIGSFAPAAKAVQIAEILMEDRMEPKRTRREPEAQATSKTGEASDYTPCVGSYVSPEGDMVATLSIEKEKILLAAPGQLYELIPAGPGRLRSLKAVDIQLTIGADESGVAEGIHVRVGQEDQGFWRRLDPSVGTDLNAEEYVGIYWSPELEINFEVREELEALALVGTKKSVELRPIGEEVFMAEGLTVRFARDPAGKVEGLLIDSGWIERLRFERPTS